jgi:hypothetical protein
MMVASGTITAVVNGEPMFQAITINPRSWHVTPAEPTEVNNGQLLSNDGQAVTLPVPPVPNGILSNLGASAFALTYGQLDLTKVPKGPNAGFAYFASGLSVTANFFNYELNPDLVNPQSEFAQHQCGSGGFISWSDLFTQTRRHEYNSSSESHWAFYSDSMTKNNLGDYVESRFLTPGSDVQSFIGATASTLTTLLAQIKSDMSVEPYPVNYSETDQPLGNINYALPSYAPCNQ